MYNITFEILPKSIFNIFIYYILNIHIFRKNSKCYIIYKTFYIFKKNFHKDFNNEGKSI